MKNLARGDDDCITFRWYLSYIIVLSEQRNWRQLVWWWLQGLSVHAYKVSDVKLGPSTWPAMLHDGYSLCKLFFTCTVTSCVGACVIRYIRAHTGRHRFKKKQNRLFFLSSMT